jgi:hypothetical protein
MASTWELPVRLFLVKQERLCFEGFREFVVALCMATTFQIPEDETKRRKVLEDVFEKAECLEAWYFQNLPEDKLEKIDDYLQEAATKLRGDEFNSSKYHHKVISSYGHLHLN